MVLGGVSTVCPECSNQWTLSPAVARSWYCPKCGGARDGEASAKLCQCGHTYGEHHTTEVTKPSRAAFGISLEEMNQLDRILTIEPGPAPLLRGCALCDCSRFRLDPPHLSPKEFVQIVKRHLNRGVHELTMVVTEIDDSTVSFARGSRTIRLRSESGGLVVLEPLDNGGPTRTFVMGRATVGECSIAITEALRSTECDAPKQVKGWPDFLQPDTDDPDYEELTSASEDSDSGDLPLADYEAAVREKPDSALAWYNYGDALLALERRDEAIEALGQAVRLAPKTPLYCYDLGLALYGAGRYADAREQFAPIVALDPKLERASSNLGLSSMTNLSLCDMELGHPDEGAKILDPARETAVSLLYNMGMLHYRAKHLARALPLVQAAAALQPKSENTVHLLGNVLMDLKREDEALAVLERATKLKPPCAYAWYDLGLTRARLKQGKQARTAFLRARKLAPDFPWVYYDLACLDALEKKHDAAFKNLALALTRGFCDVMRLRRDPDLLSLRRDSRWKALVQSARG